MFRCPKQQKTTTRSKYILKRQFKGIQKIYIMKTKAFFTHSMYMQIYEEHFFCPSCQATFTSFYFHIQNVQCNSLAARTLQGRGVGCTKFFGTLKRALLAKVPVFKCQKMALRAPKSKNGLQKPRETPPKMVGRHLVHAFPFLCEDQANF